jgi:hypothetical protein
MTRLRASLAAAACALLLAVTTAVAAVAADTAGDADEIQRQAAELRGLAPLVSVPYEIVDRDTFRGRVVGRPPTREGSEGPTPVQKLLRVLGLIGPDVDLRVVARTIRAEDGVGLYRSSERKMYIVIDGSNLSGRSKLVLVHEFTHALQDQHFDLSGLALANQGSADRALAVKALVEGDARLTQLRWGRQYLTAAERAALAEEAATRPVSALDQAPFAVREEFLFPYREGSEFVASLHRGGGNEAVNAAFREPPQSTEQILHPEKYLAREAPVAVEMPAVAEALGGSWRVLTREVLGELEIRKLIQHFADLTLAETASAGWGGGSTVVLEDDQGRLAVVLNTTWDSEADAAEFFDAYAPTVAARFGSAQSRTIDEPSRVCWSTPDGPIQILKTGDRVLLIYAPDADVLELTAAQFR